MDDEEQLSEIKLIMDVSVLASVKVDVVARCILFEYDR